MIKHTIEESIEIILSNKLIYSNGVKRTNIAVKCEIIDNTYIRTYYNDNTIFESTVVYTFIP